MSLLVDHALLPECPVYGVGKFLVYSRGLGWRRRAIFATQIILIYRYSALNSSNSSLNSDNVRYDLLRKLLRTSSFDSL